MSSDTIKVKMLMDMPPANSKRELQSFLGIGNYPSKFSPMTAEVCKPLQRLTYVKAEWKWNIPRKIQKRLITSNKHVHEIL